MCIVCDSVRFVSECIHVYLLKVLILQVIIEHACFLRILANVIILQFLPRIPQIIESSKSSTFDLVVAPHPPPYPSISAKKCKFLQELVFLQSGCEFVVFLQISPVCVVQFVTEFYLGFNVDFISC